LINTNSIYWDNSNVPITMLSSSNPYTIHYNISLSSTPNNGIQGEQVYSGLHWLFTLNVDKGIQGEHSISGPSLARHWLYVNYLTVKW
jgi:hypothetical protein